MARDGVIDTVSVLIEFLDEVRSADVDPHGGGDLAGLSSLFAAAR